MRIIAGHLRVEPTESGLYDRTVHLTWIQDECVVREVNITWKTMPLTMGENTNTGVLVNELSMHLNIIFITQLLIINT